MTTPTWGQVKGSDASAMVTAATSLDDSIDRTTKNGRLVNSTIDGLDWSGDAKDAALGRATREESEMTRVAAAFEDVQKAVSDGGASLSSLIGDLKSEAGGYEQNHYTVSDAWAVIDDYNYRAAYAAAGDDEATIARLDHLKIVRASIATNGGISLVSKADELGRVDDETAKAITAAAAALTSLAPTVAGLNGSIAEADIHAINRGTATPEQIARFTAATTLTPEQQQALDRGDPVVLPQGQFDYLNEVMRYLDGRSVDDIALMGEQWPGPRGDAISAGLGNGMRIVSTEGVRTGGASPDRGGMDMLPSGVRTLLQDNPVKIWEKPIPGSKGGKLSGAEVPRLNEFQALSGILDHADPGMTNGSFLDKGLIKQAAEIASVDEGYGRESQVGSFTADKYPVNEVASHMLSLASSDQTAVHDALTGVNMDATCNYGGQYSADTHIAGLLQHDWAGNEQGMTDLLGAIDNDSTSANPWANLQAGESANALAHYIAANDESLMNIDGAPRSIGEVNPEITKALATTLDNYIPSMAGADQGLTGTSGFSSFGKGDEMRDLFKVIDTNDEAAAYFNQAAYSSVAGMEANIGRDGGEDSLEQATWAGRISFAAQGGMDDMLEAEYQDEQAQKDAFGTIYDLTLGAVTTVGGDVPILGPSADAFDTFAADELKEFLIGDGSAEYDNDDTSLDTHATQQRQYYNVFKGAVDAGRVDIHDPAVSNYFDDNGQLKSYDDIKGGRSGTSLPDFAGDVARYVPDKFDGFWAAGDEASWE
ncbi:MAG: hypothetical protein C0482_23895 [Gordonia sp.]|nr:hypothetical protein [Gordonia sp. (in: high G+C Gram-positive bacteria)]